MSTNAEAPITGADFMRQFVPNSPFAVHSGLEIRSLEPGEARLGLPFRNEITTIGTTVHGGAIATLIDTAATVAAWSGVEIPDTPKGATVGLTINYLAPADGEDAEAVARVLRQGRRLVTVAVDVHTASRRHVATALVTYQIG